MSESIKFPSIRQPVTMTDDRGVETFTRPWFLFFQQIFERVGGTLGQSTSDLGASLFEDAGTSETNATIFSVEQSLSQLPPDSIYQLVENLTAELAAQRDILAEVQKELDAIKQGQLI